jgi:molybdate transport system regulatory protein
MAESIKNILKANLKTTVNGSLWLESSNGMHYVGPGPIELLERIITTGSISKAAAEMKMSYKKAWMLINNLNDNTNTPIVIPQVGGEKGGGSVVTEAGLALIHYHRELRKRFKIFLEEESKRLQS